MALNNDKDDEILKNQIKKECKFQDSCKDEGIRLAGACFTGGVTIFKGKSYPCFIFAKKDSKKVE